MPDLQRIAGTHDKKGLPDDSPIKIIFQSFNILSCFYYIFLVQNTKRPYFFVIPRRGKPVYIEMSIILDVIQPVALIQSLADSVHVKEEKKMQTVFSACEKKT